MIVRTRDRPEGGGFPPFPLIRLEPPVLSGFRSRSRKALAFRALSLDSTPNKVSEFKSAFFFFLKPQLSFSRRPLSSERRRSVARGAGEMAETPGFLTAQDVG